MQKPIPSRPPAPLGRESPPSHEEVAQAMAAPPEQNPVGTAIQVQTIRRALLVLVVAIWQPLVIAVGTLLASVGIHVDYMAWVALAEDGTLTGADALIIARDVLIAVLMLLVIRLQRAAAGGARGLLRRLWGLFSGLFGGLFRHLSRDSGGEKNG